MNSNRRQPRELSCNLSPVLPLEGVMTAMVTVSRRDFGDGATEFATGHSRGTRARAGAMRRLPGELRSLPFGSLQPPKPTPQNSPKGPIL